MDSRRLLAHRVLEGGWSISGAARSAGVSRQTAYLWVERARQEGLSLMRERSRKPLRSPTATSDEIIAELLGLKAKYPGFGPKKLVAKMDGKICARTAARILSREGVSPCIEVLADSCWNRFERQSPNELWQMDFKGLKKRVRVYELLSVIDDCTRFCLQLCAVPDLSLESAWGVLWEAFGTYGLPDAILTDNGATFSGSWTKSLSRFEARIVRLGIRFVHGRAYHPQTQGKVERFHGSMQRDLGERLLQPTRQQVLDVIDPWKNLYNWERPHEALNMQVPGQVYKASPRLRPDRLPEVAYPSHMQVRKVDAGGYIYFQGKIYRPGHGLIGEHIGLAFNEDIQEWDLFYAQHPLGPLNFFAEKSVKDVMS